MKKPFANAVVPCPIIEQPYEPGLRVFTSHDRAPSQVPNFRVQSDNAECKFACFGWKVT